MYLHGDHTLLVTTIKPGAQGHSCFAQLLLRALIEEVFLVMCFYVRIFECFSYLVMCFFVGKTQLDLHLQGSNVQNPVWPCLNMALDSNSRERDTSAWPGLLLPVCDASNWQDKTPCLARVMTLAQQVLCRTLAGKERLAGRIMELAVMSLQAGIGFTGLAGTTHRLTEETGSLPPCLSSVTYASRD